MATLGQQLRHVRLGKGLSEEEVAMETCIPASIVRALENDNYASFNSVTYLKNFLSTYSRFLEVDISDFLKGFETHHADDPGGILAPTHTRLEDTAPEAKKDRSKSPLILAPLVAMIFAFLCFSLFCLLTKGSLPFAPKQAKVGNSADQAEASSEAMVAQFGSVDSEEKVAESEAPVVEEPVMIEPISESEDHGAYRDDFQASNTIFLSPKTAVLP